MEFVFVLSNYDEASFKEQVSKALEKRTELVSRNEYPKMWKFVDKMNSKEKAPEEVLKKRYVRYRIYGIILIFLGFFLLIPSVVKIKEMLIPLIWSIFSISLGLYYFRYGKKPKKVKETSFDKATAKLFNGYKDMPPAKIIITEDKIQLGENSRIEYSDIERIFITEDLFIIIWNERIAVIQKKDLLSSNIEEFTDFIRSKSQDLFEVMNIN
ncbi:MAG: hypothetical protein GX300_04315 [Tissierellia bacterium]|nr:hypothetical protein [Tissierellia bacterium]